MTDQRVTSHEQRLSSADWPGTTAVGGSGRTAAPQNDNAAADASLESVSTSTANSPVRSAAGSATQCPAQGHCCVDTRSVTVSPLNWAQPQAQAPAADDQSSDHPPDRKLCSVRAAYAPQARCPASAAAMLAPAHGSWAQEVGAGGDAGGSAVSSTADSSRRQHQTVQAGQLLKQGQRLVVVQKKRRQLATQEPVQVCIVQLRTSSCWPRITL